MRSGHRGGAGVSVLVWGPPGSVASFKPSNNIVLNQILAFPLLPPLSNNCVVWSSLLRRPLSKNINGCRGDHSLVRHRGSRCAAIVRTAPWVCSKPLWPTRETIVLSHWLYSLRGTNERNREGVSKKRTAAIATTSDSTCRCVATNERSNERLLG